MRHFALRTAASALALILVGGAAHPVTAQNHGNGFLFGQPQGRITIRGGYAMPTASGDLFEFAFDELTLKRSDFSSLTGGIELAVPLGERWEISADVSYSRASKGSSFRHFIDNNDAEIEQTTTFDRVPLMANVRYYLTPPGRSVGRLAWIPTKVAPWIGAGGGMMYYRFNQNGDFVNHQNLNVFHDVFESSAWAPAVQGLGGFDVALTPMLALTTEMRYIWAKGSLGTDYNGYGKIDLSGATATVGLTVRM